LPEDQSTVKKHRIVRAFAEYKLFNRGKIADDVLAQSWKTGQHLRDIKQMIGPRKQQERVLYVNKTACMNDTNHRMGNKCPFFKGLIESGKSQHSNQS
jgi:hypothetical protein